MIDSQKIKLLSILILWILMITSVYLVASYEPPEPYNVTETVTYKDISHIGKWEDHTNYNIYTTNSHYRVSLADYNRISVGDNLTVTCDNWIRYLHYRDSIYTQEID